MREEGHSKWRDKQQQIPNVWQKQSMSWEQKDQAGQSVEVARQVCG